MIRPEHLSQKWPTVRLGDVVEFLDHKRRPITAKDRMAGPYPYYGANGIQDWVGDYIFDEALVLLAEDGGYFGDPDRAIAYQVEGKAWVNNHAHVLRPTAKIDIRYLTRHLEKYDVGQFINGATRQKLNKGTAEDLPILLPPIHEQKRIAGILDKADSIHRKRQQATALTNQLLRSVFLDMFGDPDLNPKKWVKAPIGSLVKALEGGKNVKPGEAGTKTRNRILKVSAVTSGIFRQDESKPLPDQFNPPKSYFVRTGDLLISRANTTELIGATAFVFKCAGNIVLPDKIWRFVWKDAQQVHPLFIYHLFQQPSIRREIGIRASGTSGSMKNIAKPKLLEIEIPIPPPGMQFKFGRIATEISLANKKHSKFERESAMLFNVLSREAFSVR